MTIKLQEILDDRNAHSRVQAPSGLIFGIQNRRTSLRLAQSCMFSQPVYCLYRNQKFIAAQYPEMAKVWQVAFVSEVVYLTLQARHPHSPHWDPVSASFNYSKLIFHLCALPLQVGKLLPGMLENHRSRAGYCSSRTLQHQLSMDITIPGSQQG